MKLALDALEHSTTFTDGSVFEQKKQERLDAIAALRQAIVQPARQVPTTNYVQPVPDHCDRITWRNRYYHLPLAAELSAARAQEPVSYRYKFTHPISGEPVWRDSSPMWNGQCVQEVQQLFAAPILPVREPDWLLKTTQDLARAIARDNFPDVPQWEVFDDLPGVISQIDNMVCGMERKKPVREPLSYRDILRIYNEVGPEDGVPYRFAGAIEAITKEQK